MTPIYGLLGLACRAGQVTLGAQMALEELKGGKAALVLIDESASMGTRKKLQDACAYRNMPLFIMPKDELSRACGRDSRMAAAVKKGPFAERMLQLLREEEQKAIAQSS